MKLLTLFIIFLSLNACESSEHLRGNVSSSEDGRTYLSVMDNNGGACPLYLNGKEWSYALGERVLVEAGTHVLKACSEIEFDIPEGVVFEFNYWGP